VVKFVSYNFSTDIFTVAYEKHNPSKIEMPHEGKFNISKNDLDDELYKFSANPRRVARHFLEKHGLLISYENTLVAFLDIQAYSAFIEKNSFYEIEGKVKYLFEVLTSKADTDFAAVKLDHWILSDSIIITIDTTVHPLFRGSLQLFFWTCSMILDTAMRNGFPLRGAVGGGYFYKDDELLISSALIDAAKYEKLQNWYGAVLTPNATELLFKHDTNFKNEYSEIPDYNEYLRLGEIPWKENQHALAVQIESYYINPIMCDLNWEKKYIPKHFELSKCKEKIKHSDILYGT
jgi:hypothetical protein